MRYIFLFTLGTLTGIIGAKYTILILIALLGISIGIYVIVNNYAEVVVFVSQYIHTPAFIDIVVILMCVFIVIGPTLALIYLVNYGLKFLDDDDNKAINAFTGFCIGSLCGYLIFDRFHKGLVIILLFVFFGIICGMAIAYVVPKEDDDDEI